jgi:hypothetical protein
MLTTNLAFAKIHEFETTHLKSMGGTGVAGVYMEESAFLNPASLAFFDLGDVYVQRDMLQFKNDKGDIVQKPKSTGVVMADGNPNLSGSLSYVHQEEGSIKRSRWGLTASAPLSATSSFGTSVRKTEDEDTATKKKVDYYQTVIGITHSLTPQTSLGLVAYDAFNSKADETKAIIGFQQVILNYVTIAADFGGNYKSDEISDTLLYRGGLQFRVLDDFYLRFGAFKDKSRQEKGNGYGLAWVQPKLAFEFAMKNTTQEANLAVNRTESKLREVSFAASLRF